MSLITAFLPQIASLGILLVGLVGVLFAARRSGIQKQQNTDLRTTLANSTTRSQVDAEVASESDVAVLDDLRRQRTSK